MPTLSLEATRKGTLVREGGGVKLHRYIGMGQDNDYEPFLLMDFFDSTNPLDFMAGFPSHPHRGFETITYLLEGKIAHEDNYGHKGIISAGGVQWMTAGRGVIHSELPSAAEPALKGWQIWLNLPAAYKMTPPDYQEYTAEQFPVEHHPGCRIKIIAGATAQGTQGPIKGIPVNPLFFDISLDANTDFQQAILPSHQTIIFLYNGSVTITGKTVLKNELALLTSGDTLQLHASESSQFLLLSAQKLYEPIARRGPFVMNTEEEILQAIEDFRQHRF